MRISDWSSDVCSSVLLLSIAVFGGHVGPASLLLFTFLVCSGMALFGPSWQASVGEQVTPALLPSAIALNSVSFNIARSFGPAVGGVIRSDEHTSELHSLMRILYAVFCLNNKTTQ